MGDNGAEANIPLLGFLTFAAQRPLPALQQTHAAYSVVKSENASSNDVIDILNQADVEKITIKFQKGSHLIAI